MELTELIQSIDIVAFISQYVDLTQKGEEFWGLSPFNEEKTPSFSVRPAPPRFYDFSSGIGGNVFTFVKHYHRCTSREAVEILKSFAGIDGEIAGVRDRMQATSDCKRFKRPKATQKPSKATVLPENIMEQYEKRPEKLAVWEAEGISPASLERFQVFYDSFSDRLVYPIRDPAGKIVNIGGRTLDPLFKEKKLRKYTYFYPWGSLQTLYGLFENRKFIEEQHEIILFEGCKSVLLADTWGIRNCAAILTSHLNPSQMKLLARLGCRAVFALDKDVNVRKDHNIEKLRHYINVEYIYDAGDLLDEKDAPVDKGKEVFHSLYDSRFRYR